MLSNPRLNSATELPLKPLVVENDKYRLRAMRAGVGREARIHTTAVTLRQDSADKRLREFGFKVAGAQSKAETNLEEGTVSRSPEPT
jgi:hypothetical protein